MSKDLFQQMREEENASITNQYYELIGRLQRKEETLSYSSLKEFSKSPRNFINYKLSPKKPQTESQVFGSLCDCLLTTPEEINNKFAVVDAFPSTDNQKGFCNDMIQGHTKETAFKNNYQRGDIDKTYDSLKSYIDAIISGKLVCTKEQIEEANNIVENLKKSELISQYIDSCHLFQNKKEWSFGGWNFKGFTDAEGINIIIDFKYSADSDPEKFERDIIKYDYYMQMAMYAYASEGMPECYFVVYDRSFNFSIIKVHIALLSYGYRKYKYLVSKLNQCIKENRFQESYNFFDVEIRTVFKPNYVKGFETDEPGVE